jgi:hypothetical protein
MKKQIILMSFVLMSAGVFAYTFMGAPTSELQQGQTKAGYSYSDSDIDGLDITRHMFNLGHGLAEGFEMNLLLGVASLEDDSTKALGLSSFDSGNEFAWGFNAKYTFIDDDVIDWGILYQMTWFEGEDNVGPFKLEYNNAYDIQVAAGPTIDMGGWNLYGGGFYYKIDSDLKASIPSLGLSASGSADDDDFRGYIGAQFQIMENAEVAVEYALTGDYDAFGIGISWKF